MKNKTQLFEGISKGNYSRIPKAIYNLAILAISSQDNDIIVVRKYVRPSDVEDAIDKYQLQGITVELETDTDNVKSIFTHTYKLTIKVNAFLSNLQMFHNNAQALNIPSRKQNLVRNRQDILFRKMII